MVAQVPALATVAIVGSGVSGLLCAQTILQQAPGVSVSVYEWGRGPGGRTARRRATINGTTSVSFDHAAPFFSASTRTFREGVLQEWRQRGVVQAWQGKFGSFDAAGDGAPNPLADGTVRWVGAPTMHTVCRTLSEDVVAAGGKLFFGRHVLATAFDEPTNRWRLSAHNRFADAGEEQEETTYDALVLTDKLLVLPNQYAVLDPTRIGALALPPISSEPCVVLLIALDGSRLPTHRDSCIHSWDVLEDMSSNGAVRLIIHESSKPERVPAEASSADALDLWVVHSSASYAQGHLSPEVPGEAPTLIDEKAVKDEMVREFLRIVMPPGEDDETSNGNAGGGGLARIATAAVLYSSVMVWDHAKPVERLKETHKLDAARRAGVCGDFFVGGRADGVEAAALSGIALGEAIAPALRDLITQRSAGDQ